MNLNDGQMLINDYVTEGHIGGKNNDNKQIIDNQEKLLDNNKNEFNDLVDKGNQETRDNDIDLKWHQYNERNFRFNYNPITVDKSFIISNDLVYPKNYDPYFEYLYNKGLRDVNVQVQMNKTKINIDSSHRVITPTVNVERYINLQNNPLSFTSGSNYFDVAYINANKYFNVGDQITLTGFSFYKINYKQMKFFFSNEKNNVVINLKPNFDFTIPYYNIVIKIENVSNGSNAYFKNIPLTLINNIQNISTTTINGDNKMSFQISIPFYSDNTTDETLISDCSITYYYIGNYPINLINAKYPITQYNLIGYQKIYAVNANSITIKLSNTLSLTNSINLNGNWNGTTFITGGKTMQIAKIIDIQDSFNDVNHYVMPLKQSLNNIVCIKMISSEFVNTQKVFTNIQYSNNKLYWLNSLDSGNYSITIPSGNYDIITLKNTIQTLMRDVPRIIINSPNLLPINDFIVNFNTGANITSFNSYNNYQLPNCLYSLTNVNNNYIIRIQQPYHNQQLGNTIIILNSINYYTINKNYINTNHIITNIINNEFYEITITNINLDIDVGNTKGGNEIIIKTSNSFCLLFNKDDTCGNQIGFSYVGTANSITPYCSLSNNYTITNQQPYIFNIAQIILINNNSNSFIKSNDTIDLLGFRYFLIRCKNLNQNTNPNGIDFFYKIQLNGTSNTPMFNTFVDTPVYFNPPLNVLTDFEFTFIDPNGNPWNFYNINHSFTLEITNVNNYPANTNLTTYMSKL
jgi:hypothetical protein